MLYKLEFGLLLLLFCSFSFGQTFNEEYNDSVRFQADEAYNLDKGEADYYVWYGCGKNEIDKPLIIVEGYDPFNRRGGKELYFNLVNFQLVTELREEGYDIIGFNPKKGGTAIQRNGLAFAKLIEIINDKLDRNSINHD